MLSWSSTKALFLLAFGLALASVFLPTITTVNASWNITHYPFLLKLGLDLPFAFPTLLIALHSFLPGNYPILRLVFLLCVLGALGVSLFTYDVVDNLAFGPVVQTFPGEGAMCLIAAYVLVAIGGMIDDAVWILPERIFIVLIIAVVTQILVRDRYQPILPDLTNIDMPPGFVIREYANVPNARSLTVSPSGIVYVGNKEERGVYIVMDKDGDDYAESVWKLFDGKSPNGVAYSITDGTLYIVQPENVVAFPYIEMALLEQDSLIGPADFTQFEYHNEKLFPWPLPTLELPSQTHHDWRYAAIGPDGYLYVSVGAPCNICDADNQTYATIMRTKPGGRAKWETFVTGVRNSLGFDWHPITRQMWFTENARDFLDNDTPDELNAARYKANYGYPYCYGDNEVDLIYSEMKDPCKYRQPAATLLDPHSAPLGMTFYFGKMFPEEYTNAIFIAEHGSWNRVPPSGFRLSVVHLNSRGNVVDSYKPFATGFSPPGSEAGGRPVDVKMLPDGSLVVSDDANGKLYRITYEP